MQKISTVLMERDSLTFEEAQDLIESTRDQILEAIDRGSYLEVDDILMENLGLEPDFVEELLNEL